MNHPDQPAHGPPPVAPFGPPPMPAPGTPGPGVWGAPYPGFGAPPVPAPPRPDPRPGWSDDLVAATVVMVALAVLGVLWGYLWYAVTPAPEILMTADGPVHADASSEAYFASDGMFAILGAAVGVLGTLGCWALVRRHRGPLVMFGTVAGCLISAVVAWQVGRHIGLPEFERLIEHASTGESFRRPMKLVAHGLLAVPGFTAAFTYTLLAGWSRYPGLRRPGPGEWPAPQLPPPAPAAPAPPMGPWQVPSPPG